MNQKPTKGWFKHADFIILDLIMMQASFTIAYWLIHSGVSNPYIGDSYRYLAVVFAFSQIAAALFSRNYSGILRRGYYKEIISIVQYEIVVAVIALLFLFVAHQSTTVSRLQFGFTLVFFLFTDYIARSINKWRLHNSSGSNEKNKALKSLVVITSGKLADEAYERITNISMPRNFFISGFIILDGDRKAVKGEYEFPILSLNKSSLKRLREKWVDEVVVVPAAVNGTPVNSISFPVLGLGIEMVFIPASVTSINMQFATPRYDAAFWINLLIVLIGCAFAVAATVAAVKENSTSDRKFLGLSLVYTGVKYYTLLIIVSAVSLIVGLPLLVQIIAAIIFVALGAAEFIKTKTAAEIVEQVDEKVTVQTSFIKTMTSEAERLMSRVSEPEEKAVLREVCEALRYSDPMSSQELSEIETKISEKFDELSSAVVEHSTEKTKTIASELVTLVGERNRKCKGIK